MNTSNSSATRPRVIVLMPSYRAGQRVIDTFQKIPRSIVDKIIIIDDASPDDTFALAKDLPAHHVSQNQKNMGYGGNMKVLLQRGLATGGDIFVELHADGQYDPAIIPTAIAAMRRHDGLLLGSRLMKSGTALHHGMPKLKYVINIILTAIANIMLGMRLTEFQSGFRVYSREFLERANFTAASDDHLFSFETILQAVYHGFTVNEIPVVCTYDAGVTQMSFRKGLKYSTEMLYSLVRFWLAKAGRSDPVFQKR